MAIRKIQTRPSDELPAAKLFLDDVSVIAEILRSSPQFSREKGDLQTMTKFIIGQREFDTVEDLASIGGTTSKLLIQVSDVRERWNDARVTIERFGSRVSTTDEAVRARMAELFRTNGRWWSNAVRAMPDWLGWFFWLYVCFIGVFLALVKNHVQVFAVLVLLWIVILIGAFAAYFRHSIVYLRFSYGGGFNNWIKGHGSQIVIAVLGAIVGALASQLLARWLK